MQQLVRTTRSSLIFAAIVSQTLAVPETRSRKCCPEGMVLSFLPELICTIPERYTSELITVDPEISDHQNEWKTEDANIVHLSTLNTTHSLQMLVSSIDAFHQSFSMRQLAGITRDTLRDASSCVEIMQEGSTNESALVAINYRHSENDKVEEHEQPNAPTLQLLNIRKCCSRYEVSDEALDICMQDYVKGYDVDSPENYSNIHEFLSLLPKLSAHFVEVSKGFPSCSLNAPYSYDIAAEDIQFENGVIWVTTSENGTPYRMPASIDNSCLDLNLHSKTSRRLYFWVCNDECQISNCMFSYCPHNNHSDVIVCSDENVFTVPSAFHDALTNHTDTIWNKPGMAMSYAIHCPFLHNSRSSYRNLWQGDYMLGMRNLLNYQAEGHCTDVFDNGTAVYIICHLGHLSDIHTFNNSAILDSLMSVSRVVIQTPIRTRHKQLISQRYAIISFLDLISCVFLLLTLLVYIYLPFLQNLHGKTLMCTAASLLVSYACNVIIIWATPPLSPCCLVDQCTSQSCAALGYITLFSWLSAFSWLNVMCFDIWRTFGRVRENRSGRRSQGKRFLLYSTYAWSLALIITLFCVASDQLPFIPESVKPSFGLFGCWFRPNTRGEIIFFELPIGIQLISNVVFFILTSKYYSKVKAEIRRVADGPPEVICLGFHADKAKLIMNVKLFVVMGIMWIAAIASSLLSTCDTCQWKETVFYWLDTMNRLHGVLIFILFVLKPRVYRALKERLRLWRVGEGFQLRDVHDSRPEQNTKER